jgi:hypothetical protein
MEQPTLFYAGALTLALLGAGTGLNAALAGSNRPAVVPIFGYCGVFRINWRCWPRSPHEAVEPHQNKGNWVGAAAVLSAL